MSNNTIECVLAAYKKAGLTGTPLRSKITRASRRYEKHGLPPKNLVELDDPRLVGEGCHKYHINGVTFFTTVNMAKKSPLYLMADELGRTSPSPAFIEARRRKGQLKEEWRSRVTKGRLERTPRTQSRERTSIQKMQQMDRHKIKSMQEKIANENPYYNMPKLIGIDE